MRARTTSALLASLTWAIAVASVVWGVNNVKFGESPPILRPCQLLFIRD